MEFSALQIFFSVASLGFFTFFIYVYRLLVSTPKALRSELEKQGLEGPEPSFLYGNIQHMKQIQSTMPNYPSQEISHDYYSKVFPYFHLWEKKYGAVFMYSTGNIQHLYVTDPVMVREISLSTSLDLGKPTYIQKERGPLFGNGILMANGPLWAHQRKLIAPQFFMDKVKGMVKLMLDSAVSLADSWDSRIETAGGIREINVDKDLRNYSADIISKACFGSSYSKGKDIFQRLRALQMAMAKQGLFVGVPGLRSLPTKRNRELWRLEKEIRVLILKVVKERRDAKAEKDLLQIILEGAINDEVRLDSVDDFIVDNCKNIYFAGHETTATSSSWILVLLATYPEWQTRVRDEVLEHCGHSLPDMDMLRKMKTMTMVIQEALRLYPPAPFITREALEGKTLGGLNVPKGVGMWVPIITMHQEVDIWGEDALEFNPERFSRGIGKACKFPQAYMPFGAGPRTCAGQNFAMVELKMIVAVILSKFSFTLSPKYRHCPAFNLVIEPKDGVDLLLKRL